MLNDKTTSYVKKLCINIVVFAAWCALIFLFGQSDTNAETTIGFNVHGSGFKVVGAYPMVGYKLTKNVAIEGLVVPVAAVWLHFNIGD